MRVRASALPVLLFAFTTTAAAQAVSLAPATPWSAKPVGTYEIELSVPADSQAAATLMPNGPLTAALIINEKSDSLTATFWKRGDNDGHTMSVTTRGTDLVLDAQTPRGALRITLQQHGPALTGSWTLAGVGGTVKGKRTL